MKKLIIRLDDVGKEEACVWTLLNIFLQQSLPVACQVVPLWLTEDTIHKLNQMATYHHPHVILHQHGYAHVNHAPSGKKYEFGHSRSCASQDADITNGMKILEAAFPSHFVPYFTSPHDRLNQDTLDILEKLAFKGVFGSDRTFENRAISSRLGVVRCIDCSTRVSNRRLIASKAEICHQIAQFSSEVLGLSLHAQEFCSVQQMVDLAAALSALRENGYYFANTL